jgi:hypothetical protein
MASTSADPSPTPHRSAPPSRSRPGVFTVTDFEFVDGGRNVPPSRGLRVFEPARHATAPTPRASPSDPQ